MDHREIIGRIVERRGIMSGLDNAVIGTIIMVVFAVALIVAIVVACSVWASKETRNIVFGYLIVLVFLAFMIAFAAFYGFI